MRMTFAPCLFVSPVLQPLVLHCFSTNTWSITQWIDQSSTSHEPAGQVFINELSTSEQWVAPASQLCASVPLSCEELSEVLDHSVFIFFVSLLHFTLGFTQLQESYFDGASHPVTPSLHIVSSYKQNNIWPAHHQQVTSDHDLLIEDLCCSEVCFVCSAHCLCLFIKQRNLTSH